MTAISPEPDLTSELIDVGCLNLADLDALPDTALAAVLRGITTPDSEGFAAFTSALV